MKYDFCCKGAGAFWGAALHRCPAATHRRIKGMIYSAYLLSVVCHVRQFKCSEVTLERKLPE